MHTIFLMVRNVHLVLTSGASMPQNHTFEREATTGPGPFDSGAAIHCRCTDLQQRRRRAVVSCEGETANSSKQYQ